MFPKKIQLQHEINVGPTLLQPQSSAGTSSSPWLRVGKKYSPKYDLRRLRGHKLGRFDSEWLPWLPWQLPQSRKHFIHIFFSWHHFISEFHKTSNSVPFSAAVPGPFPRIPRNQGLNWLNPSTKQVDHLSPWLVRGSTSSHPLSGSPVESGRVAGGIHHAINSPTIWVDFNLTSLWIW